MLSEVPAPASEAAPVAHVQTTLVSERPLLARIPDESARRRIALHERTYKEELRVARERERVSLRQQDEAVARALQAGKDKRQVRKLKNRLSAIRSRQRKDSEHTLTNMRLMSLEEQVRGLTSLIHRLQSRKAARTHRVATGDLDRVARGRLAFREDFDDGEHPPTPRVRGTGTIRGGNGKCFDFDAEALLDELDCAENSPPPNHSVDLSYLTDFPILFGREALPQSTPEPLDPFSSPSSPSPTPHHDHTHHYNCPFTTASAFGKLAKSRKRNVEPSTVVQEPLDVTMTGTNPGHALNSTGISSPRRSTRSVSYCGGAWMDHINGGTRMLPGRRVLSSVRLTNATQESKEAEVTEATVSAGSRRTAWQAQEARRRNARTDRGAERTEQAYWRLAARKLSMLATLLLWQRKRRQRRQRRKFSLRKRPASSLEMQRARRSWKRPN